MMSLKTLESNEGRSIIDTESQVSLTFLIEFPIVIVAVLVVSWGQVHIGLVLLCIAQYYYRVLSYPKIMQVGSEW